MKTYIDKQFDDIKEIKRVDLQQLGAYYSIPIKNIYEDKRKEFDYEDLEDRVIIDNESLESGEYVEYFDEVEYEYTDEYEIDYTLNRLMNYEKYKHYLVVLFNSRWTGASGYKIFDNYIDTFYRDYDDTMYVSGSSKSGKYLALREHHHDCPMGHDTIIIGLTENEYQKLDKMNIDEIIDFGKQFLDKVIYF